MSDGGLKTWFRQKWIDVKSGKECGRSGSEKSSRAYPACRPAKAAKKLSSAEKTAMTSKKTGPARQSWPVSPSGKRKPAK
jgi:hypothetical protein